MTTVDIRTAIEQPVINGIKFDRSDDLIVWDICGLYISINPDKPERVCLSHWVDFDNLIMALKKAKELHELQQKGGEK